MVTFAVDEVRSPRLAKSLADAPQATQWAMKDPRAHVVTFAADDVQSTQELEMAVPSVVLAGAPEPPDHPLPQVGGDAPHKLKDNFLEGPDMTSGSRPSSSRASTFAFRSCLERSSSSTGLRPSRSASAVLPFGHSFSSSSLHAGNRPSSTPSTASLDSRPSTTSTAVRQDCRPSARQLSRTASDLYTQLPPTATIVIDHFPQGSRRPPARGLAGLPKWPSSDTAGDMMTTSSSCSSRCLSTASKRRPVRKIRTSAETQVGKIEDVMLPMLKNCYPCRSNGLSESRRRRLQLERAAAAHAGVCASCASEGGTDRPKCSCASCAKPRLHPPSENLLAVPGVGTSFARTEEKPKEEPKGKIVALKEPRSAAFDFLTDLAHVDMDRVLSIASSAPAVITVSRMWSNPPDYVRQVERKARVPGCGILGQIYDCNRAPGKVWKEKVQDPWTLAESPQYYPNEASPDLRDQFAMPGF